MSSAIIHHHLGLGDHIDCNGLVRFMLENSPFDKLEVIVKKNYREMISYMYRDEERIDVIEIDNKKSEYSQVNKYKDSNPEKEFIRVGHEYYREVSGENKNCWERFYEQFNIPSEIKYSHFRCESDEKEEERVFNKLNPENEDFIFVHDESSSGKVDLKIDTNLKIIKNDITENIFHFAKVLKEAKEIHLMESSFKSMAEHFPTDGELYFHDNRAESVLKHPIGKLFKEWKVLNYES